jgi:hypothetical protein
MAYNNNRIKARLDPNKKVSLIFDGAKGVDLPFVFPPPSHVKNATHFTIHPFGVIDNGTGCRQLYLHHGQFGHGPNLVISILHQHLYRTYSNMPLIPSQLYLQMDNCWRENKNLYVLGYLGLLLHYSLFEKIKVSLLPPGHTHANIDQMFSTFIIGLLSTCNTKTLQEFVT